MLKTFNKAQTRYPIVFYEEKIAAFQIKTFQIEIENDKKKTKWSRFLKFLLRFLSNFC